MSKTEKITVNMSVVDLGKIDLLVEQGFYSNRTDLIKTAIRNQLSNHSYEIQDTITRKNTVAGIVSYNKKDLQSCLDKNEQLDIKVIGKLILNKDITSELALKTIKSIQILGTISASDEVKSALKERITKGFTI